MKKILDALLEFVSFKIISPIKLVSALWIITGMVEATTKDEA